MAIRFVDKPPNQPPRNAAKPAGTKAALQTGAEARFATPIETAKPVNPDASSQLAFADLPEAEKAAHKKHPPKASPRK